MRMQEGSTSCSDESSDAERGDGEYPGNADGYVTASEASRMRP